MLQGIRRLIPRLLLVAAWLVVIGAGALLVIEESGLLTGIVRSKLAARLGPLGDGLGIEQVRLRWFEPGLIAHGVTLRAPLADGEAGLPDSASPFLEFDSVHLSIDGDLDPDQPLRMLRIQGGRVRVSDDLFNSLDELSPEQAGREEISLVDSGVLHLEPPTLVLTDIEVDLELPDGELVELGRVSLAARPEETGGYRILGELTPTLAGAVPRPVPIHIDGSLTQAGAELHAAVRDLRFDAARASLPAYLGPFPVERISGSLTTTASSTLTWSPTSGLHSEVRASIAEARMQWSDQNRPLENAAIELHSTFDYRPGLRLWDREAWSAQARIEGSWAGSPLLAHGQFGRDAPGRDWAHLWGRLEELHLDSGTLEGFHPGPDEREAWGAFAPTGTVDAAFDLTLPSPEAPLRAPQWNPEVLLHVRHVGTSGMTFRGWRNPEGVQEGIPIPATDIRGDILVSYVEDAARPLHVGLVGLDADHGSGRVEGSGLVFSTPRGTAYPEVGLDLLLHTPSMAIDERMRDGLAGMEGTRDIWSTYHPEGGTIAGTWRLHQDVDSGGLTAYGEIDIEGTKMRWRDLPIPLEGLTGHMTFAWAAKALLIRDLPGGRWHRPIGLTYRFTNATDYGPRSRAEAVVVGMARQPSWAPEVIETGAIDFAEIPEEWIQDITVTIPDLLLRGADWETLAQSYPRVGEEVTKLGAKGSAWVRFRGRRATPTSPYFSEIEATPNRAEITPSQFVRRTRDLRGRMLATSVAVNETDEPETNVRLALAGSWSQGVELAIRGAIPPRDTAQLDVYGAGVDPTNTAFKGALAAVLAEGGQPIAAESFDTTGRSIRGLLDFAAHASFDPNAPDDVEPETTLRVHLRGNELENGSLRLSGLRGVLERTGDQWRSARIEATLAGHPLELREVMMLRLGDVPLFAEADPLLRRPGFWSDPDGFALQAELHVADLPVDEEHLSSLLGEEALVVLRDSATWSGAVDVPGARILLTSEADGEGKVAIQGRVEPHDLAMRLGLPIRVDRGVLQIRELVFEQGLVRGWGEIERLDALIAGRRLANARMIVGYVDGRLTIDNLGGDFEGGSLQSLGGAGSGSRKALGIDLSPPYRFDVAVRVRDVPLDRLLQGVFPSPIADQGVVNLALQVSGTPGEVLGLTGSGWVRLEEGRLWSIPVMRELFNQLGFDQTAIFDRLQARFQLQDGVLETPDIEIKSRIVNLVGDGALSLDGTLRYDLEMHYSLLDRLKGPNLFVYWVNNLLWRVAVRGDMARPEVRIRNAVLEILRPFRTAPRSLPLPEFSPLPRRF